jgi:hypothetical protein
MPPQKVNDYGVKRLGVLNWVSIVHDSTGSHGPSIHKDQYRRGYHSRAASLRVGSLAPSRLTDCEWLWQRAVYWLIGYFDVVDPGRRWPLMAPADERCNPRFIPLGHRLDTAVGPIGHPASETQRPRCRDRRGTKSDSLYTPRDAQPFAYVHAIYPTRTYRSVRRRRCQSSYTDCGP